MDTGMDMGMDMDMKHPPVRRVLFTPDDRRKRERGPVTRGDTIIIVGGAEILQRRNLLVLEEGREGRKCGMYVQGPKRQRIA